MYKEYGTLESLVEDLVYSINITDNKFLIDNAEYYKQLYTINQTRNKLKNNQLLLGYKDDEIDVYNPIETEIFPVKINGNIIREYQQEISSNTLTKSELYGQVQYTQPKELTLSQHQLDITIQNTSDILVLNFLHPLRIFIDSVVINDIVYTDIEQYNQLGITLLKLPVPTSTLSITTTNSMVYTGTGLEIVFLIQGQQGYVIEPIPFVYESVLDTPKLIYQDENHSYYQYFYYDTTIKNKKPFIFTPQFVLGADKK